jgi:glycosyltransferase involved in cell wall biosynthesis
MAKEENNIPLSPVSIIIPCLNEEHYIGTLLSCLARQTFKDFEVLVIDAYSTDDTRGAVARTVASYPALDRKVQFVSADKGVAHQRNVGASKATHERLLFLDADVQVPDTFLESMLKEIRRQDITLATAIFEPISDRVDDKFFYYLGNIYIQMQQFVRPVAMGFCIFSTKTLHRAIGGFDEKLRIGEDFDYVHRATKERAKLRILTQERVFVSIRRLNKEGRFTYYKKAFFSEMEHLLTNSKEAYDDIEYDFGVFNGDEEKETRKQKSPKQPL